MTGFWHGCEIGVTVDATVVLCWAAWRVLRRCWRDATPTRHAFDAQWRADWRATREGIAEWVRPRPVGAHYRDGDGG